MSEKELRETINSNHLEVMTGLAAIEERFKHVPTTVEVIGLIDSRLGSSKKGGGKWYTSKLAKGLGAFLAALATGLTIWFTKIDRTPQTKERTSQVQAQARDTKPQNRSL